MLLPREVRGWCFPVKCEAGCEVSREQHGSRGAPGTRQWELIRRRGGGAPGTCFCPIILIRLHDRARGAPIFYRQGQHFRALRGHPGGTQQNGDTQIAWEVLNKRGAPGGTRATWDDNRPTHIARELAASMAKLYNTSLLS